MVKIRNYRISLNTDAVSELVTWLLELGLIVVAPYFVGRVTASLQSTAVDPSGYPFPKPLLYWSSGAAVLMMSGFVLFIAYMLILWIGTTLFDIEKVTDDE